MSPPPATPRDPLLALALALIVYAGGPAAADAAKELAAMQDERTTP